MSSELNEVLSQIESDIAGVEAPVGEVHEEAARAATDLQRLQRFVERLADLKRDTAECHDEPDLMSELADDAIQLAQEVRQFRDDSPLARRFFKSSRRRRKAKNEEIQAGMASQVPPTQSERKVSWRAAYIDFEHPIRWDEEGRFSDLSDLMERLSGFETLTWSEVEQVPHCHPWDTSGMERWQRESRDRLMELELDDRSGWYQLSVDRLGRLFGFRSDGVFHIVWWDRTHSVYRTGSR